MGTTDHPSPHSLPTQKRRPAARLAAFGLTTLARALTGVRSLWTGCAPEPRQRVYFANHTSHTDFLLLWASLPPALRAVTRPVAGADYWLASPLRRFIINDVFNGVLVERKSHATQHDKLTPGPQAISQLHVQPPNMQHGPAAASRRTRAGPFADHLSRRHAQPWR
mgnify:CR=1 FL=1